MDSTKGISSVAEGPLFSCCHTFLIFSFVYPMMVILLILHMLPFSIQDSTFSEARVSDTGIMRCLRLLSRMSIIFHMLSALSLSS